MKNTKETIATVPSLSRRERQIMDAIYELGRATAAEVREHLPDPPSYSAVRAHLRILEEKEQLVHVEDGPRYVYQPRVPREEARVSALSHLVRTFFDDSPAAAVAALLDLRGGELGEEELERLQASIEAAREEGR